MNNLMGISATAKDLIEPGAIALLVVLTKESEVVMRPIGGNWGCAIVDAVEEMADKYPGCRMRLFERQYDDWERYFKGIVSRDQVFWKKNSRD